MSSAVTGVLIILPSLTNATAAVSEGYPAAFINSKASFARATCVFE